MEPIEGMLTVFFEDPFWVGVYERRCGGCLEATRVVFGAEPKDCEVYAAFLDGWGRLRFSPPVQTEKSAAKRPGAKRMQRLASRQLARTGAGTKAQQALSLLQEQNALERKEKKRRRTQEEEELHFRQHIQKKKQKHRGR